MTKLGIVMFGILALAGCKKKATVGDCAGTVSATVDRILPDITKTMSGMMPAEKLATLGPKMKAILTTRCTEDKWSADYVACIAKGNNSADMTACDKQLPAASKANIDRDLSVAMKEMMVDMSGGPGAMAAPAPDSPAPGAAPAVHEMGSGGSAMAGSAMPTPAEPGSAMAGSGAGSAE